MFDLAEPLDVKAFRLNTLQNPEPPLNYFEGADFSN